MHLRQCEVLGLPVIDLSQEYFKTHLSRVVGGVLTTIEATQHESEKELFWILEHFIEMVRPFY